MNLTSRSSMYYHNVNFIFIKDFKTYLYYMKTEHNDMHIFNHSMDPIEIYSLYMNCLETVTIYNILILEIN